MKNLFKRFIEPIAVKLLVICMATIVPLGLNSSHSKWIFAFSSAALAASPSQSIPPGWESYLDRPDVLKVTAQAKEPDKSWDALKAAHFSLVAELLVLYPKDTHLYFLARDSEYLYDVARLVTQGTDDAQRLHLLNVSRANMRHQNLLPYLKQNGISTETLSNGRKVVFIDTGFAGTIPRVIGENFPLELRTKLKTHLIVSANAQHPSSRTFLVYLNPSVNDKTSVADMHGSIVSYEHMPRYTDRSSQFIYLNDSYHPLSLLDQSTDGSVSKQKSLLFMQDLKAEWQKPEMRARFQAEKTQLERIKQLLLDGSESAKDELRQEVEQRKNTPEGRLFEAQIKDFLEAKLNAGLSFKLNTETSGLYGLKSTSTAAASIPKKFQLMQKYPEWAAILENPDDKIPELFKEKNWLMIGNLIDANVDDEINNLLRKSLFDEGATGEKRDLQLHMVAKADNGFLMHLIYYFLSKPQAQHMDYVVQSILEKTNNSAILAELEIHVFSRPHAKGLKNQLKLLIEKRHPENLDSVVQYVFSQPHTEGMEDLLELVIKKVSDSNLDWSGVPKALLQYVFPKPHSKNMFRIMKYVFENTSSYNLKTYSMNIFSQLHNQTPEHLTLKKSIEISDPAERKQWIDAELSKLGSITVPSTPNGKAPAKTPSKAINISTANSKSVSPLLQPGDVIVVRNSPLKVIKKAGEGRRGVVFQVQGSNGAFYALKVAKNSDPDTLSSLVKESTKAKDWQALKIPHSKVLVQESKYILKTWIEGTPGDQVIEKYHAGDLSYKNAAESLLSLVTKIKSQGAYVGDFRPANLIWTGKSWVIVDSGSVQQGMSLEDAKAKWASADEKGPKFQRRWKMPLPTSEEGPHCHIIFKNH